MSLATSKRAGCGKRKQGKRTTAKNKERKEKLHRKALEGKKLTRKEQAIYNKLFEPASKKKKVVYAFANDQVVVPEDKK